jgi:hypothetical protein
MKRTLLTLVVILAVSGCANKTVRQQDLDAWVGVPVEALDTHSLFLTIPMVKTITDSGVEIRIYANKSAFSGCSGMADGLVNKGGYLSYASFQGFQSCVSKMVGCDNVFYIKNKKVIQYKPVGQCYTDETIQPEYGFERFMSK